MRCWHGRRHGSSRAADPPRGLAFLSVWATALAGEPELIERLPGAIDGHTIVMLGGSRAMVACERDDSWAHETVWTSRRWGNNQLWPISAYRTATWLYSAANGRTGPIYLQLQLSRYF